MDKLILRKIAADWCKAILLANGGNSFDEEQGSEMKEDEINYILNEVEKIAERITKRPTLFTLKKIIGRYYTFESD